jgi:hypothetical protein
MDLASPNSPVRAGTICHAHVIQESDEKSEGGHKDPQVEDEDEDEYEAEEEGAKSKMKGTTKKGAKKGAEDEAQGLGFEGEEDRDN